MFSSEILSIYSCKESKQRDGQVDRQVLTAPEASTICKDGFVTGVVHHKTSDCPRKVVSIQ